MNTLLHVGMVATVICLSAEFSRAAEPSQAIGFWVTQDHESVVQIGQCQSGLCGTLVGLRHNHPPGEIPKDTHNSDPNQANRPLCGMLLMGGFKPAEGEAGKWEDGWVYDPESGRTYSGGMRTDGADTLKLRGFVGISLFGRTETWTRESGVPNRCTARP